MEFMDHFKLQASIDWKHDIVQWHNDMSHEATYNWEPQQQHISSQDILQYWIT